MTAFHWLLGWWFFVTVLFGLLLSFFLIAENVRWRAHQSSRR